MRILAVPLPLSPGLSFLTLQRAYWAPSSPWSLPARHSLPQYTYTEFISHAGGICVYFLYVSQFSNWWILFQICVCVSVYLLGSSFSGSPLILSTLGLCIFCTSVSLSSLG